MSTIVYFVMKTKQIFYEVIYYVYAASYIRRWNACLPHASRVHPKELARVEGIVLCRHLNHPRLGVPNCEELWRIFPFPNAPPTSPGLQGVNVLDRLRPNPPAFEPWKLPHGVVQMELGRLPFPQG